MRETGISIFQPPLMLECYGQLSIVNREWKKRTKAYDHGEGELL